MNYSFKYGRLTFTSLQVYSADGEFLFKFGSHGEGNGQFNAPTGVAVDVNGNIIVADWGNSRIQVTNPLNTRNTSSLQVALFKTVLIFVFSGV